MSKRRTPLPENGRSCAFLTYKLRLTELRKGGAIPCLLKNRSAVVPAVPLLPLFYHVSCSLPNCRRCMTLFAHFTFFDNHFDRLQRTARDADVFTFACYTDSVLRWGAAAFLKEVADPTDAWARKPSPSLRRLHFPPAVVPGAIGSDAFVQETGLGKRFLKACRAIGFGIVRAVGEFRTAVGWDTRDGIRDSFRRRAQKTGGCADAVLRKGFKAAETETTHRGRLAELLSGGAAYGFLSHRFSTNIQLPLAETASFVFLYSEDRIAPAARFSTVGSSLNAGRSFFAFSFPFGTRFCILCNSPDESAAGCSDGYIPAA